MSFDLPTFPVSLVLVDLPCLVVGGHGATVERARALVGAGAALTVIAPSVSEELLGLDIALELRRYLPGEARAYHFVIAATGIDAVDRRVAEDATRAGVLVNVVDDPRSSTCIFPAIFRRGNVSISVSTDGHSPAFAAWLRDEIGETVGEGVDDLLDIVASVRTKLRSSGQPTTGRDWRGLIETTAIAYRKGGIPAAKAAADAFLQPWLAPKQTA